MPHPPTPVPTTILERAVDFVLKQCEKPQEDYLFLKVSSYMRCSPRCDCPEIEPRQPAINRDGEDIRYNFDHVIGLIEPWKTDDPAVGLLIDGWFEDRLYAVDKLPFEIGKSKIQILGCRFDGTAIIEIGGNAYNLPPDKGWARQSVVDEGEGCFITWTLSLRNDGMIEKWHFKSDLSAIDDHIRLEVKDKYFSLEEDVIFDIVVIGDDNIDFSDFCSITFERLIDGDWQEVGECGEVPDYVPEPFPRLPGALIEITMPISTMELKSEYKYDLDPGSYRIKVTYHQPEGYSVIYSPRFHITR
jgi:hypothetical protein